LLVAAGQRMVGDGPPVEAPAAEVILLDPLADPAPPEPEPAEPEPTGPVLADLALAVLPTAIAAIPTWLTGLALG
jgi:hypothetical protein